MRISFQSRPCGAGSRLTAQPSAVARSASLCADSLLAVSPSGAMVRRCGGSGGCSAAMPGADSAAQTVAGRRISPLERLGAVSMPSLPPQSALGPLRRGQRPQPCGPAWPYSKQSQLSRCHPAAGRCAAPPYAAIHPHAQSSPERPGLTPHASSQGERADCPASRNLFRDREDRLPRLWNRSAVPRAADQRLPFPFFLRFFKLRFAPCDLGWIGGTGLPVTLSVSNCNPRRNSQFCSSAATYHPRHRPVIGWGDYHHAPDRRPDYMSDTICHSWQG